MPVKDNYSNKKYCYSVYQLIVTITELLSTMILCFTMKASVYNSDAQPSLLKHSLSLHSF